MEGTSTVLRSASIICATPTAGDCKKGTVKCHKEGSTEPLTPYSPFATIAGCKSQDKTELELFVHKVGRPYNHCAPCYANECFLFVWALAMNSTARVRMPSSFLRCSLSSSSP